MDEAFGKILEEARQQHDITRTELASVIGRSESSVFRYEKGEQIPNREMYEKMCDYLDLPELSYEEMFFSAQTAGVMVLLEDFWRSMEMGKEAEASEILVRLSRQMENGEISKELREEILLARYLFFYANYQIGDHLKEAVHTLLLEINGKQEPDVAFFRGMAKSRAPQSRQEVTGYNLWALLLLRDGEYVLPEVVFSTLLFLEKKKLRRRNYHRETILAGNLALAMFHQEKFREALEVLERNETLLFYTGGVESHLFYETLKLSCFCYLEESALFERHWIVAEELYRKVPKTLRNEISLETLVFGRKKGLLIFRK